MKPDEAETEENKIENVIRFGLSCFIFISISGTFGRLLTDSAN